MNKPAIYLLLFLVMASLVVAQDGACQPPYNVTLQEPVTGIFVEGSKTYVGEQLRVENLTPGDNDPGTPFIEEASFVVVNTLLNEIMIEVTYDISGANAGSRETTFILDPYASKKIAELCTVRCDFSNIKYRFLEPSFELATKVLARTHLELGTCLADGVDCVRDNQCAGNHCTPGGCSHSIVCPGNNCRCEADELQRPDSTGCFKVSVLEIGSLITYSQEECKTGYAEIGICAERPSPPVGLFVTVFVTLLITGIIILLIWRYKRNHEWARIERIAKETEHQERKIESINKEIELLKKKSELTEAQKESLRSMAQEKHMLLEKMKADDAELTTPRADPQASGRFVIINPYLGGYKCFYQKQLSLDKYPVSSLLHRWVWKQHNGRYPKQGYHIHHKDDNKYNNDPSNLEEIHGEEHFEHHRNRFKID